MPDPVPAPMVDSISSSPGALPPQPEPPRDVVQRTKVKILLLLGVFLGSYVLWCLFLVLTLPDPAGGGSSLVRIGVLSSIAGTLALIAVALFSLKRISASETSIQTKRLSLFRLIGVFLPALLLSIATPLLIIREPAFPIDIVSPRSSADLIAPVAVTLNTERTAAILKNMGFTAVRYQWDTDGDGRMNDDTVLPTTTVVYDRQGTYTVIVKVLLEGGTSRTIRRRIAIPQAVFSMVPIQLVVSKPVKFSVATLVPDPKQIKQVQWDFGDGNPPQTSSSADNVHTYFAVGSYPVTVSVLTQTAKAPVLYKRTVTVQEAPPLPFPITLGTEPGVLVGPSPFGLILRLDTKEPLQEIAWSFSDGTPEERGADLTRASHSFDRPGIYPVVARVRSADGKVAELVSIVRVTETLTLGNLQFDGTPAVNGNKIIGEVPLEISLKPKTTTPLVQFSWEVSPSLNLQVKDATLSGIFRTEGSYTLTLLAQSAEGKSARIPVTVEVKPPSAEPAIELTPDGGVAPLTVTFDASKTFVPPDESVAGFKWLFGDEGQGTKIPELGAARVTHAYRTSGEFKVKLTVVLTSGKEFSTERTIIVRKPVLSACITPSRLAVEAGKGIEFDASCSTGNASSILWDVRKDDQSDIVQGQSSDESYVFVFPEAGDYTVTLTLKDSLGNQDKKSVSISVTSPDQ